MKKQKMSNKKKNPEPICKAAKKKWSPEPMSERRTEVRKKNTKASKSQDESLNAKVKSQNNEGSYKCRNEALNQQVKHGTQKWSPKTNTETSKL